MTLESCPKEVLEACAPISFHPLAGGTNSSVWLVKGKRIPKSVLKFYPDDGRQRGLSESRALTLLTQNLPRHTPKLLLSPSGHNWSLIEWVDGQLGRDLNIQEQDIQQLVQFIVKLYGMGSPIGFQNASDSCFGLKDTKTRIQDRRKHIEHRGSPAIQTWLHEHWDPQWQTLCQNVPAGHKNNLVSQIWLSPSDLGFHNGIQQSSGKWTFIDFEYFGYDDFSKSLCDLLLHPGMSLSSPQQKKLIQEIELALPKLDFKRQTSIYLPFHAMKWALITLNPLLDNIVVDQEFIDLQWGKSLSFLQRAQSEKMDQLRQTLDLNIS